MIQIKEEKDNIKAKQKFPLAKLQEHCYELFGVTTSTFAGATNGKTGDYTIDEIKKFLYKN